MSETDNSQGHFAHSRRLEELGAGDSVRRPIKVVFLGAGSGFLERLFIDILAIPGADVGELALVDIDAERLKLGEQLCRRIVELTGKNWTVTASADRRGLLGGADYIINCIEVSGVDCVRFDNDIPAGYGVDQCIGDTTGPGGLFKALRTVPVFLDVLEDVEALCPDAWVLNYTNPMSIMCLAAAMASDAKVVGLCHSVQGSSRQLAEYTGVPFSELKWSCAGINHMAWFTELSHDGRDLYPELIEKVQSDAELWEKDPVRFDMMLHFGCFVTESSGHHSEYVPYYRKRPELIAKYCRQEYLGQSGFYADQWPGWRAASDARRRDILAGKVEIKSGRSIEYASRIIEAMETNRPGVIYGSVLNNSLVENLPTDGVVEVACLVDRNGVTPANFGVLPAQLAALCRSNMGMFELAAIACVEKSRTAAEQALMLDPLTAAVCCPSEIRKMTAELFDAEKEFLPGF
ncbi:MAG: alpha-galactosidase [Phycisphaerae bacterium]|jgi:alpha-galactosidase|nr:alpha-galactosidase [Phycisphaerae bacterium]